MNVKTLFTTVSLFIALICSFSSASNLGLYFKAGLNLSKYYGTDVDVIEEIPAKFLPSVAGGVGLRFQIVDMFTIQPELLFASKGTNLEETDEGDLISMKFRMNYLELPILFKFNIPASETVMPGIYAGPALSILLTSKLSYSEEFDGEKFEDTEDFKDESAPLDFGLVFGGDLAIKAGKGRVILDFRYTLGLLSVIKAPDDAPSDYEPMDVKNSTLSIFAGYGVDF